MLRLIISSTLLLFFAFAQDIGEIAPKPLKKEKAKREKKAIRKECGDNALLVEKLKGLRLLGNISLVKPYDPGRIRGIQLEGLKLPGPALVFKKKLKRYLNRPLTKKGLVEIKQEIILHYQKCHRPIVDVYIPEQEITEGGLQIVVYESKLHEVAVQGNCFFSASCFLKEIRALKNCPINTERLVEDLDWLNQNPFRDVDAIFVPSIQEGYTDIELQVKDRTPIRFYTGVENTGLDLTGHNRWFVGVNCGNLFRKGHIFTYQFMTGSHLDEFWANSFSYFVPLSWRHMLTLYGGFSEINAITVNDNQNAIQNQDFSSNDLMKVHGFSVQASLRYTAPLKIVYDILQDALFGFDYKRTDTSLTPTGQPFVAQNANLTQFVLGYNQGYEKGWYKHGLTFEVFCSPFQWLPDQSDTDYQTLRRGASNTYIYARAVWNPIFTLPNCFVLAPTLRWQLSSANLLASEQLGLGGYNSVRGYQERSVNVDIGVIVNIDFRLRPLPFFSFFRKARGIDEGLVLVAFFDLGYGKNHKIYPGDEQNYLLYSVGPGLRYHFGENISVRADWGQQLKKVKNVESDSMLQFGASLSF